MAPWQQVKAVQVEDAGKQMGDITDRTPLASRLAHKQIIFVLLNLQWLTPLHFKQLVLEL